jgi:drug/metabolite transporter (DMT)-like permease
MLRTTCGYYSFFSLSPSGNLYAPSYRSNHQSQPWRWIFARCFRGRPGLNALRSLAPIAFLLMWSSGSIFVKLGLASASVWSFLAIRASGALILLVVFCAVWYRRQFVSVLCIDKRQCMQALTLGLLLQGTYQGFFFLAIADGLAPGTLALILGLQPLLTPLIARERLPFRAYALLALGFAGLVLAIYGARGVGAITPVGVACGLASVLSMTVGSVYQQRLHIHPLPSAIYQNVASSVAFAVIVAIVGWHVQVTPSFILASAWMICVVSVGALLLLLYLLSTESASSVGVLFYLIPIVTMVFDYLVFGTNVSAVTGVGAALVLSSVWLYRRQGHCGK